MFVLFEDERPIWSIVLLDGATIGENARARCWVAFHCHCDSKVSVGKFVFVVRCAILASLAGGSSI